ncbi:MAG: hypothetical protein M3022_03425 [Actinomycetota bacterium]|nr:hypothetical protein [Actinomycetota bacterium]
MRRATLAVVVLSLGLAIAGCGAARPTKRDFIARADAICASSLRATRSIRAPAATGSTALAGYLNSVLLVIRSEAAQLRGLHRPPGGPRELAQLTAYLRALDDAVAGYASLAAAAQRDDQGAMADAQAALRANRAAALAVQYGLRACGAAGSTAA